MRTLDSGLLEKGKKSWLIGREDRERGRGDGDTRGVRRGNEFEENFVSFILLHLKAIIYARVEVKRNATSRERGGRSCEGKG